MSKVFNEEDLNPYTDTKLLATAKALRCNKQDVDDIDLTTSTIVRNIAMRRVELLHNKLKTCEFIEPFPQVTYLNLAHNKIKKTRPLTTLSQIVTLNLSHNMLEQTLFISQLSSLKALILNNNKLTTIPTLKMPHLDTLILSHNSITSVNLSELPDLNKLSLAHNALTEFPNISANTWLKTVALQSNQISKIPDGHIGGNNLKLFIIQLQFNKIEKFRSLKPMHNSKVEKLQLFGNPVLDKEDSTNKLLVLCPNLLTLDNKVVRKAEGREGQDETSETEEPTTVDSNSVERIEGKPALVKKKKLKRAKTKLGMPEKSSVDDEVIKGKTKDGKVKKSKQKNGSVSDCPAYSEIQAGAKLSNKKSDEKPVFSSFSAPPASAQVNTEIQAGPKVQEQLERPSEMNDGTVQDFNSTARQSRKSNESRKETTLSAPPASTKVNTDIQAVPKIPVIEEIIPWDADERPTPKVDKRKMDSGVVEVKNLAVVKGSKRQRKAADHQVLSFFGEQHDIGSGTTAW